MNQLKSDRKLLYINLCLYNCDDLENLKHFADHVVQDAAVAIVSQIDFSVEANDDFECLTIADVDRNLCAWRTIFRNGNIECFLSGKAERFSVLTRQILQWCNAHTDQVGTMDTFI